MRMNTDAADISTAGYGRNQSIQQAGTEATEKGKELMRGTLLIANFNKVISDGK